MSDVTRFKNKEPLMDDFPKLSQWIEIANNTPITNDMVINFFRQIFRLLEINNMCFSSGAFVFENYGNILFNLLTYNKLLVNDNSYYCDDPLGTNPKITPSRILEPADVYIIGTETHDGYYRRYPDGSPIQIRPSICMPATKLTPVSRLDRTKTKFERLFRPKVENICGYCELPKQERSEPKGLALYYPFYISSQTYPDKQPQTQITQITQMLYLKFEASSAKEEPFTHTGLFLAKSIGIKKEYRDLDTRREDRCDYNDLYLNKDVEFYRNYCPEDIEILNWYNTYIRLGCEFFVSKGLLTYFFKTFLLTNFNCSSATSIQKISEEISEKKSVGGKTKIRTKSKKTKSRKNKTKIKARKTKKRRNLKY